MRRHRARAKFRKQLPLGTVLQWLCADCGSEMVLKIGSRGYIYKCTNCDAIHFAHLDGHPHGKPADFQTRKARAKLHNIFDGLWKGGLMMRRDAYRMLARIVGVDSRDVHIGKFSKEQCEKAIEFLSVKGEAV